MASEAHRIVLRYKMESQVCLTHHCFQSFSFIQDIVIQLEGTASPFISVVYGIQVPKLSLAPYRYGHISYKHIH